MNKIAKKNGILLKIKLMHVKIDEDLIEVEFLLRINEVYKFTRKNFTIRVKCNSTLPLSYTVFFVFYSFIH